MPKRFEQDACRPFFYSNHRRPIHIHARHGGSEAILEVEHKEESRQSQALKAW